MLQHVDGWYYLLSDEIGSTKYLKVTQSKPQIDTKRNIYFIDKYSVINY